MTGEILIVEDDADITQLERDYLEMAGFTVEVLGRGDEVMRTVQEKAYDLILLDVMLPGKSGYEICRELRKKSDVPIILVTARGESVDIVHGLGLGSDDYIAKPFDPAVLVARVKACLARCQRRNGSATAEIEIGEIKIISENRQAYRAGQEVKLTTKEYELLLFLARNTGKVFSKTELFENVWGLDSLTDEATITVHINRLREKLESDPAHPQLIKTVWGEGYRFCDRKD